MSGSCKKIRRIWGDGTYRGSLLEWAKNRIKAVITPVLRKDKLKEFVVVPKRWVSERTFAWLYNNRRLSKDYERQTLSSEAMIHIAMMALSEHCQKNVFRYKHTSTHKFYNAGECVIGTRRNDGINGSLNSQNFRRVVVCAPFANSNCSCHTLWLASF